MLLQANNGCHNQHNSGNLAPFNSSPHRVTSKIDECKPAGFAGGFSFLPPLTQMSKTLSRGAALRSRKRVHDIGRESALKQCDDDLTVESPCGLIPLKS
jgi:hypothetical protein